MNLLEVYQWNLFLSVYINKEDFYSQFIISNDEREVFFIIAMAKLHIVTRLAIFDRLPVDLVKIFASFKDCAVSTCTLLNMNKSIKELLACNLEMFYGFVYFVKINLLD